MRVIVAAKVVLFALALWLLWPAVGAVPIVYGALATDSVQGYRVGYGIAFSQSDANARAVVACGGGCSIVAEFQNACAAYAADMTPGSSAYGRAWSTTRPAAERLAYDYCRAAGGTLCTTRVWACTH